MDPAPRPGASGSLWRDALKAGRRWWIVAGVLLVASIVIFLAPFGPGGLWAGATNLLGAAARVAVIVGLALASLAAWRLVTTRIAAWPVEAAGSSVEERRRRLATLASVAWRVGASVIVLVAGTMILAGWINVTPVLAAASVGGLALTLASQKLLKDFLAGAEFLLDDAAAVGEWVTAAKLTGRVRAFGLRALVLEGFDGTLHRIPNSAISELSNHSRNPSAVLLEVEVGFTDDPGWLVALLNEEATRLGEAPEAEGVVLGTPVSLGMAVLSDTRLTARVRVPCRPFAGPLLARIWRDRIGERLAQEGRAIAPPYAVRTVPVDEPAPAAG